MCMYSGVNLKGYFMLISNISIQNYNNFSTKGSMNEKPSFTSIHRAVYFVKGNDGKYTQVSANSTIKTLQRKIVTWLNQSFNDAKNIRQGKSPKVSKSETADEKALKIRLARFFQLNDPDYAKRPFVRSFYTASKQDGRMISFILSGPSCDMVEAAAKPIGQARGAIKTKKDNLSKYFGIEGQRANAYLTKSAENSVSEAAKNYRSDAEKIIKNLLSQNRPKDMRFEAYFVPYMKGKEIKYRLEDAYLKREVRL